MTPTDKLRALLDERRIEHDDNDANTEVTGVRITRWKNGGKRDVRYEEWRNGTTRLDAGNVSPEQAIAATVGVGTCKLVDNDSGPDVHCTACGGGVDDEYRYFMDSWGYSRCPHCGARIIEEETER